MKMNVYLVTGLMEFYKYVEADSEEEAHASAENGPWYPTMNQEIQNVKVKPKEIETTGDEVK